MKCEYSNYKSPETIEFEMIENKRYKVLEILHCKVNVKFISVVYPTIYMIKCVD